MPGHEPPIVFSRYDRQTRGKQIVAAARWMAKCQAEPVWWTREALAQDPWQKQREILESIRDNPRTAVASCHGAGKSFVAGGASLWWLFSHPHSLVATTAPTYRQVEKVLWQEIQKAYANARWRLGGRLMNTQISIEPKWFAFGFSTQAHNANAFQGLHGEHVIVIFDEASGIPPEIWDASEGALSGQHARFLAIGNPTDPDGNFAREFKVPGTKCFHISAFDTPNFTTFGVTLTDIRSGTWEAKIAGRDMPYSALVTPAWVADKWRRWGEGSPLWAARVMGQFPLSRTDALIPSGWIERACNRSLSPEGAIALGVDVARFGEDETTIYVRRGPVVRKVHSGHGHSTMETCGLVRMALASTGAEVARVDVVGIGAGVVDRLAEQGDPVQPVNVGESAFEPDRFANLRAQAFWSLRERFENGLIDIDVDDDELIAQLSQIRYSVDSRGRIAIESKDKMKARGVASPDRADAVAMAFLDTLEPALAMV